MYIVELRGILIKSWYITCTDFASLENMYARKKVIAQESYSNFEKKNHQFLCLESEQYPFEIILRPYVIDLRASFQIPSARKLLKARFAFLCSFFYIFVSLSINREHRANIVIENFGYKLNSSTYRWRHFLRLPTIFLFRTKFLLLLCYRLN